MQFNVPTQFPILDPIPAPYPAEYWGVKLCGSYVSKISQPLFQFDLLSTPVHVKWVRPFYSDMVRLNFVSATRSSLPSIPSTERTNREKKLLILAVLTLLIFIDSLPPRQERRHWLILGGIHVSVVKFYVNDGVSLLIP